MAVELLDYSRFTSIERDKDAQEAAYAGLESMQRLIHLLSHHHNHPKQQKAQKILPKDCSIVADSTIHNFKKVVSVLSRSGHARFRKAPAAGRGSSSLAHLSDSTLMEALASCSSSEGAHLEGHRGSAASQDSQSLDVSPNSTIRHVHANMPDAAARGGVVLQTNLVPKAMFSKDEQAKNAHGLTSSSVRQSNPYTDVNPSGMQAVFTHMGRPGVNISQPNHTNNAAPKFYGCEPGPLSSCLPQDFLFQSSSITKVSTRAPQTEPPFGKSRIYSHCEHSLSCTPPPSTTTSSFLPSLSIDGSVTTDKSSIFRQAFGGGRPPLCGVKRKCPGSKSEDGSAKCHSSGKCHCSKRRKSRNRRVVMVPCVSSKTTDTPTDEFSWRKYGSKAIKGSPHPRGYYRCSTMRGCPAKKHVERALDDANMLVVTYAGEHSHSQVPSENA